MLNKFIAFLLTSAVMTLSFSPSKVLAQTQVQASLTDYEQRITTTPAKPKSDLKAFFTKEMAKTKSDVLTEADFKRFEKERLFPKSNSQAKKKDRTTLAIVIFAVAVTAVIILVAKYGVDNPEPPRCFLAPDIVGCIP